MDFTNNSQPYTLAQGPLLENRPFPSYPDIRWAGPAWGHGQPLLFAAAYTQGTGLIDLIGVSFQQ
jgi:hypothetical protein